MTFDRFILTLSSSGQVVVVIDQSARPQEEEMLLWSVRLRMGAFYVPRISFWGYKFHSDHIFTQLGICRTCCPVLL